MLRLLLATLFTVVLFGQQNNATQSQLARFVDSQLMPVLYMVMEAKLPFPVVNERIKKQDILIKARFGSRKVDVRIRRGRHELSPRINGSSGISSKGDPLINLYAPALLENCEGNQGCLLRIIMHERDHLTEVSKNESSVNVEQETHFHALTTEFVIVPLKEMYKIPLVYNDQRHYEAWVQAGRSEKSLIWRDYVRRLHAPVVAK